MRAGLLFGGVWRNVCSMETTAQIWAWVMVGLWWATLFLSGSEGPKVLVWRVVVTVVFYGACVVAYSFVAELVNWPGDSLGAMALPLFVLIAVLIGLTHKALSHHRILPPDKLIGHSLVYLLLLGWIPSQASWLTSTRYSAFAAAGLHILILVIALFYVGLIWVACMKMLPPRMLTRMAGMNLAALAGAATTFHLTVPYASHGWGMMMWFILWPAAILVGLISVISSLLVMRIAARREQLRRAVMFYNTNT